MTNCTVCNTLKMLPWVDRFALELVDRIVRRITSSKQPQKWPIFIIGAGRSGTTLLGVMLNIHPNIAITPETHFLRQALYRLWRTREGSDMVERLFEKNQHVGEAGVSREELMSAFQVRKLKTAGTLLECFYELYAAHAGKRRWGDDTPAYTKYMRDIQWLFGRAVFIHMIRDGRDVAASVLPLPWGPNTIEQAAQYWKENVQKARKDGKRLRYHEVLYEELILDTEKTLRAVCDFLGEPFVPQMMDCSEAGKARLAEFTNATLGTEHQGVRLTSHMRIAGPLDVSRIGRWRKIFSRDDNRKFLSIAGDLLVELGYRVE